MSPLIKIDVCLTTLTVTCIAYMRHYLHAKNNQGLLSFLHHQHTNSFKVGDLTVVAVTPAKFLHIFVSMFHEWSGPFMVTEVPNSL